MRERVPLRWEFDVTFSFVPIERPLEILRHALSDDSSCFILLDETVLFFSSFRFFLRPVFFSLPLHKCAEFYMTLILGTCSKMSHGVTHSCANKRLFLIKHIISCINVLVYRRPPHFAAALCNKCQAVCQMYNCIDLILNFNKIALSEAECCLAFSCARTTIHILRKFRCQGCKTRYQAHLTRRLAARNFYYALAGA